jgi:hypothetical protein
MTTYKEVTDLQPNDVFTHLNGSDFLVLSVTWAGGDNYKINCLNAFKVETSFTCDVHTQLNIKFDSVKVVA